MTVNGLSLYFSGTGLIRVKVDVVAKKPIPKDRLFKVNRLTMLTRCRV